MAIGSLMFIGDAGSGDTGKGMFGGLGEQAWQSVSGADIGPPVWLSKYLWITPKVPISPICSVSI
jgi:hypothetical protein